jgi:hypothetical protein
MARLLVVFLLPVLLVTACQPKATPGVDTLASTVAQAAFDLLTQTAAAVSPTPPPPTPTLTPIPTETPTSEPTSDAPPRLPQTVNFAGCWFGPGPTFQHETNIKKGKGVELLGVGSVPGWWIIRDPYFHRPCWIQAVDLKIFPGTDTSTLPVMTPGVPGMGQ